MVVYTDNCLVDLFYNTFMVRWLYTHETTVTNENYKVHQSGRITGGETLATFNGVRVEINDPDQPLYGFWTSGEDDSNRWVARLSSLING